MANYMVCFSDLLLESYNSTEGFNVDYELHGLDPYLVPADNKEEAVIIYLASVFNGYSNVKQLDKFIIINFITFSVFEHELVFDDYANMRELEKFQELVKNKVYNQMMKKSENKNLDFSKFNLLEDSSELSEVINKVASEVDTEYFFSELVVSEDEKRSLFIDIHMDKVAVIELNELESYSQKE